MNAASAPDRPWSLRGWRLAAHALVVAMIAPLAGACGGGDPPPPAEPDASTVDAAPLPDAPPVVTVKPVSCAGATLALTVNVPDSPYRFAFTPDPNGATPSIPRDAIVMFDMPRNHNAVSGSYATGSDGKFRAEMNARTCFQFPDAGTYSFMCELHQTTTETEAKFTVKAN